MGPLKQIFFLLWPFLSELAATVRAEAGRGSTTKTGMISNSSGVKPSQRPTTATSEKVQHL